MHQETRPIWISQLLLRRSHESSNSSSPFTTADSGWELAILLCIHVFSFLLNLFIFSSLWIQKSKRKTMKLRISVMLLLLFNMIFSLSWLIFGVIFDLSFIWKDLSSSMAPWLKEAIEEIFLNQIVDNGFYLSGLILFSIALDRYLNLFTDYSPFANIVCFPFLLTLSFLIYACLLIDFRTLAFVMGAEAALFSRICLLIVPHLISFLFLLISSFRVAPPHAFEPRLNSSLSRSFPRVNLLIVTLDLFTRLAFFFKLLEANFDFVIATGSAHGDQIVATGLDWAFKIAKWLYHLFPLYFCLFNLCLVRYYRILSERLMDRIRFVLCCSRARTTVDYQSETLASILAEQRKRRMFVASSLH